MSQVNSITCGGVPSGACDEQVQRVTAGVTGVSDVDIECALAPPCTRAKGAGTAVIKLANGQQVTRAWSYVGDPGPLPAPICVGLARDVCTSQMQQQVDAIPPSKHIVGVTVTCTKDPCADASGEAEIKVLLGDGSVQTSGSSWSNQ